MYLISIRIILGLIFSLLIHLGYAYPCADINFTPYAGSENLIFLQRGVEKIESWIDPAPNITRENFKNPDECPYFSQREQWIRRAKSTLLWLPVSASCVVTQHEVFGHGYRIRDLGPKYASVTGYKMYVLGGATSLHITNELTSSQELTIDIAGVEADAIMANKVRFKWLESGEINGRQSLLYLLSASTLTGYTFSVHENPKSADINGNDISNYLFFLNSTYQDSYLSYVQTRNLSLINFADPFFYYAILSSWAYIQYSVPIGIPMFHIGPVKYLPSARLALTPFGLQGFFENFFLINSIPTYVYLKYGQNGLNTYYGFGVENQKVFSWKSGSLGFRADVWNQPHVLFEQGVLSAEQLMELPEGAAIPPLYPTSVLNAKSVGGAFSIIGSFALAKSPLRIFSQLGYKSAGYLPGEALRAAPLIRGGLSGQF